MRLGYRTCFHTLYDEKKKKNLAPNLYSSLLPPTYESSSPEILVLFYTNTMSRPAMQTLTVFFTVR